ncbi:MAG: cysteine desulfurase-like protein [Woeseiaceae bacterium]|nr:cysteine desulfurase-like protein [Woeseiaceae bacterium]
MNNLNSLDLDFVRGQFPGLNNGWTLFDNAGGTQILARSVDRLNDFLFNMNVQTGGSYDLSIKAANALESGRQAMMHLTNASRAEEIAFASSSTVALQNLAKSMRGQFKPGDEVIVTVSDHESNIGPWTTLEEFGVTLKFWNIDPERLELNLDDLQSLLSDRTKLVAVTYVSNILGTINPIADIAKLVHSADAKLCVDAVAFAPHRAIDVAALDVDYLVFSLYKVFGPHFAVLYGKYDLLRELDNLYHYFYGKEKVPAKLEPGNASYELAYASIGIVDYLAELAEQVDGAGSTRDKIVRAFDRITLHENAIAERLLAYLRSRSDCRILGFENGSDERRVPTISFVVDGQDSGQIAKKMDAYNIAIRFGDFHARRLLEFLNLADNGGCVRVSMAHYNTISEVDALIGALEEVL